MLFLGDVVGRAGREAVCGRLPALRRELKIDFAIVNGENAAGGFGITKAISESLFEAGADVITGGNHSWDQREALSFIDGEPRLLRPLNYPTGTPGRGAQLYDAGRGRKVLVLNVMGQLFMAPDLDDPFAAVQGVLARHALGRNVAAIVLDFHAETTSETMAMGHFVDGRVSFCVGSHTHVPTADATILPGGSGFQCDAGMCGDYDSVIGMEKSGSVDRFVRKVRGERLSPASGPATLCGLFVETDDATGLATRVEPLQVGGRLRQLMPSV